MVNRGHIVALPVHDKQQSFSDSRISLAGVIHVRSVDRTVAGYSPEWFATTALIRVCYSLGSFLRARLVVYLVYGRARVGVSYST